jgi:threonylcarbamoyladenosine tRNA methylthiotransferase MtaB
LPAILTQIVIGENPTIRAKNDGKIKGDTISLTKFPTLPRLTSFKGHTRAFLKVQDGCDGLCSYCIVPKVRPNVQSKPIDEAIEEAKVLVAAGHKEIVVTGVCLGAYGRETVRRNWIPDRGTKEAAVEDTRQRHASAGRQEKRGSENLEFRIENEEQRTSNIEHSTSNEELLPELLTKLAQVPGLMRIRVSSLEPGDITEELLDVFCAHKNIMPHIHLSVQSGSEQILKRMCRPYDADQLREKISLIKSRLDRPAITSDIIVGFPTETDEDFQATVELAKWAGFSKIHVFPFSVRAGTPAAKLKDRIQPKVVKERAEILRKVSDDLGRKFREQFIGHAETILIEGFKGGQAFGHCERYFMVYVGTNGQPLDKNQLVRVCLTGIANDGVTAVAEILNSPKADKKRKG